MESASLDASRSTTGAERPRTDTAMAPDSVSTAAHQAFWLLRIGFTVAPILFGLDKFFNWSVNWPDYLAGLDQQHHPWERPGLDIRGRRHRDRSRAARGDCTADRRVRCRRLAGRDRHQPADQGPARVLRHRPARLRADARRADARPAVARRRACPQVGGALTSPLVDSDGEPGGPPRGHS